MKFCNLVLLPVIILSQTVGSLTVGKQKQLLTQRQIDIFHPHLPQEIHNDPHMNLLLVVVANSGIQVD